jgi:hypothetical protein
MTDADRIAHLEHVALKTITALQEVFVATNTPHEHLTDLEAFVRHVATREEVAAS